MIISPCRHHPPFLPPVAKGFSLIEVMLALAIASLGFITMLGLLPHGLQLVQDSAQMTAEARIKQKLAGELLTASWDQLNWEGYGPSRYFNDQGIEVTAAGGGASAEITYVASVRMPAEALDLILPAAGQSAKTEDYLRRVKVCIATSADPGFDFDSAPKHRVRSYVAILPKM